MWVPCPCCENYWCNLHEKHAYDCPCPPIEEWNESPYRREARMATAIVILTVLALADRAMVIAGYRADAQRS